MNPLRATIEAELVEHRVRVMLEVALKTGEPAIFPLFFDTGAASVTLDRGHLPESWIACLEEGPEAGLSMLAPTAVTTARLGEFTLGPDAPVWAAAAGSITAGRPFAGVAGARVAADYILVLDYRNPAVRLEPPGAPAPEGFLPVPVSYHPDSAFPRVMVEIGGVAYPMLFDSGASVSMISEAVADDWRRLHPDWPQVDGSAGLADMGVREPERLIRVPSLSLGPLTVLEPLFVTRPAGRFEDWMSRFMAAPIVGAVAGNVLRMANWWVDMPGTQLLMAAGAHGRPDSGTGIGIKLARQNDRWRVVQVLSSNHPATRQALAPGDVLLAVNDAPVSSLYHHQLSEILDVPKGTPLRFTVLRQGSELVTEGQGARYI